MVEGVIGDASLMSGAPCADDALERLKAIGIEHIGIHVNLDEQIGWSTPGRERFPQRPHVHARKRSFSCSVRERIRFQIEKVITSGFLPTHIDTHHHVHGFQPIFDLILDLMKEYNIPAIALQHRHALTTREPIPFHAPLYEKMRETLKRAGLLLQEYERKVPERSRKFQIFLHALNSWYTLLREERHGEWGR